MMLNLLAEVDPNSTLNAAIAAGAVVGAALIGGFFLLRSKKDEKNEVPPPQHGAEIRGVKSRSGSAEAIDQTGKGALIADTEVEGDVRAVSSNPDPKA